MNGPDGQLQPEGGLAEGQPGARGLQPAGAGP